jgi:hypothetical protein
MRKTTGAKIVAIGFIGLTLLGNFWLIQALFAKPVQEWVFSLFISLAATVGIGAAVLGFEYLKSAGNEEE